MPAQVRAQSRAVHAAHELPGCGEWPRSAIRRRTYSGRTSVDVCSGPDLGAAGHWQRRAEIPAMDTALRLPIRVSTATSNFMIGVTACASACVYFSTRRDRGFRGRPCCTGLHRRVDRRCAHFDDDTDATSARVLRFHPRARCVADAAARAQLIPPAAMILGYAKQLERSLASLLPYGTLLASLLWQPAS